MCFPVSDDYLICCCSWRKEELGSICPVCRLLPGHVCPLLAGSATVSDNSCMAELTQISKITRCRVSLGIFPIYQCHHFISIYCILLIFQILALLNTPSSKTLHYININTRTTRICYIPRTANG